MGIKVSYTIPGQVVSKRAEAVDVEVSRALVREFPRFQQGSSRAGFSEGAPTPTQARENAKGEFQ
jgi:hypothetical protein